MNKAKIGETLKIHCYKHDGTLFRTSEEALVLDIGEDFIVCGNIY